MSATMKRFAYVALALALAVGLMPAAAWLAPASQAAADESTEVAPLVAAAVAEPGDDVDAGLTAQAAADEAVKVAGVEYYSKAREVLAIVNKERAALGRSELKFDEKMMDAAMQRATELAIFYSHTRPDGSSSSTAIPADRQGYYGENIAMGQKSAADVMKDWFDSERDIWNASLNTNSYNGKALPSGWQNMPAYELYQRAPEFFNAVGHYLNIINPDFKSIGIGCFTQGGLFSWTQEFSSATPEGSVKTNDVNNTRSININYQTCGTNQGFNLDTNLDNMKVLNVGSIYKMSYCIYNAGFSRVYGIVDPSSATWTSSNTGVCTVSKDGIVKGVGAGTATITARLGSGRQLTHQWTVSESVATIPVPDIPNQTYTGSPIEPNPTVTSNGKTLVRGTDYTVSYSYNVNVGMASMTITGIGKYSGVKELRFTIVPASITAVELSQTRYAYNGQDKWPDITVKSGDRVLTENADYYVTYPGDMRSIGNHTITVTGMGNHTGSMGATFEITEELAPGSSEPDPNDPGQVMYRLYNPNSGEHFYTASDEERWHLIDVGWNDEGTGWTAPTIGEPVYRLYNPYAGEHHYTPSAGERDVLVAAGWNDEGIGWQTGGKTPLYRLYNPNAYANNHHYTTEAGERDILLGIGWRDEQVGWYGLGK